MKRFLAQAPPFYYESRSHRERLYAVESNRSEFDSRWHWTVEIIHEDRFTALKEFVRLRAEHVPVRFVQYERTHALEIRRNAKRRYAVYHLGLHGNRELVSCARTFRDAEDAKQALLSLGFPATVELERRVGKEWRAR